MKYLMGENFLGFYFERQDSSDKGPAVDFGDGSSVRHQDGLQLFDRVHRHHHFTATFRVVTPGNKHKHRHTELEHVNKAKTKLTSF